MRSCVHSGGQPAVCGAAAAAAAALLLPCCWGGGCGSRKLWYSFEGQLDCGNARQAVRRLTGGAVGDGRKGSTGVRCHVGSSGGGGASLWNSTCACTGAIFLGDTIRG